MNSAATLSSNIRNLAIIAHVDHGKTTLVDQLLRQSGVFRENQAIDERAMDSMDQERERGITIKAKNTSVRWQDYLINVVDTPGHADFGGEVERVMKMVDGVMLVVDSHDGPQAQTRFVLQKALAAGLLPVVFINKIDRPNAQPAKMQDLVLELFLELEASDEQFNAPFLFGSAKEGFAKANMEDESSDMLPLFQAIVDRVPPPVIEDDPNFRMLVSNVDWSDYVGRIAVGKVLSGSVKAGNPVWRLGENGVSPRAKVTKVFEYSALATQDLTEGVAGNIVGVSGFEEVDIGETLSGTPDGEALPFVQIDPPTVMMSFSVNDGPLAGRDGDRVTSREIRERLFREARTNVSIKVIDGEDSTEFKVSARGAMQVAVLVETMRREGFELGVSRPEVVQREIDGVLQEPYEQVVIDVEEQHQGAVMEELGLRKAELTNMEPDGKGRVKLEFIAPARGLIGFRGQFLTLTSGSGIMTTVFDHYGEVKGGEMAKRQNGVLVSMVKGKTLAYGLFNLQDRGRLFLGHAEEIYEGQIIGLHSRSNDLVVNATKAKQLTNVRASGTDDALTLTPPVRHTLEQALEFIEDDELVEVTPKSIRLRKKLLTENERKRAAK